MSLSLKKPALLREANLIDGQWLPINGAAIEVINPATGEQIGAVPKHGSETCRLAVAAAKKAFASWSQTTAKERHQLLMTWYRLIVDHVDDLALILTAEHGKPLAESRGEILSNAAYIEWFAEEAKRIDGEIIPAPSRDRRLLVLRKPVGVCAAITPWNFPMGMLARKAGPALAAGCTMVVKPASKTPFSALALAYLAEEAGIPAGVLSVITGGAEAIGLELCHNKDVAKISFTGSTEVGRWLMRESSSTLKKLSMELGGNAPFIVFADADVDAAVEGAMVSKFRNSGQTCVCANRFYVAADVADEFTDKLAKRVRQLKVGNGLEPTSQQGPLIDTSAVRRVEEQIADAVAKGAKLVAGGQRHSLGGLFFEPSVLSQVTHEMRVCHEETFGPLAPILVFENEADAVAMANDSDFGLAGYFYSRDLARAWRVAEQLQCGIVGVNAGVIANEMAPFGGVKQSGYGREGSKHGISDYLDLQYVCMGGIG